MRSVSVTKGPTSQLLLTVLLLCGFVAGAQENSPYSRYGWGNLVPSTPIVTRGMGGISAGYLDYDERFDLKLRYPRPQTLNFLNPASLAKHRITSFDLGFQVDNQVLREQNKTDKFKASFANISYIQLGIPISRKHNFAMVLGLRPISRINYKIQSQSREINPESGNSIDSVLTLNEGTGGSYQAYAGLGKSLGKNFSIGANFGYHFGTKDISTRKNFLNDSVLYRKGNYQSKINFGGVFLNTGIQYIARLDKKTKLVIGATTTLKQDFNATRDLVRETYEYDGAGGTFTIDSVYKESDVSGKVRFPASYSVGFTLERQDKWMIGADYTTTAWDDFRVYGVKDSVVTNNLIKVGGQFTPNPFGANYWGRVTYRAGFNFGTDYIKVRNEDLNQFSVTAGFGFPVRPNRFTEQYTNLNLALEYGKRGSTSTFLQENVFRVSLGFTLSDLWFVKRKYD